uniref:CcxH n=1 Tax=Cochliobolus sativus TaxID=45130 RepID=A0A4D6Q429_COCSA|nr:CcxH [Bipolaris sorokiniana]
MGSLAEVMKGQSFLRNGDRNDYDPERWQASPGDLPERLPVTGLKVLVVGAGTGGLMSALECWRNGHEVVGILERSENPVFAGDIIIFGPSAIRTLRHWPQMCKELAEDSRDSETYYRRHYGELILGPSVPIYNDPEYLEERQGLPFVAPFQIRRKFHEMLLRQVARIGLKVQYGQRAEKYFEDDSVGVGGVLTQDGVQHVADLVIAADGHHSNSELLIADKRLPTRSSGMSVYRTAFPTELAMRNDAFRKQWGERAKKDTSQEYWLGPGMHIGILISPDLVAWGLTPRDQFLLPGGSEPKESWDPDVSSQEVLAVLNRVSDWHPAIQGLVSSTPEGSITHWPLLWRNLRPEWTSKSGRVVQVGDAAHTTVPSSVSGGTLAVEDAVTLAACLRHACTDNAYKSGPLGARVYNLLRYERASCVQKMAFVNSQLMGATNWENIRKDPKQIRLKFPKWVFRHDVETYVDDKFSQARAHVLEGKSFQNTNIPAGHVFESWTIEEIHKDIAEGKVIADLLDGDWS